MARFLPRPATAAFTTVTLTGWFLMVEFLAASQATFQKGQILATDKLMKLGSLVQRCQPKEWYDTKGSYGCTVPSEASATAVQLKTGIDNAAPEIATQIHNFMVNNLPEGLLQPVATAMQEYVADQHALGIADIATKADLVSLQARLAARCGDVLTTGPVCGTTNRAIAPLVDSLSSIGAGSPQELVYFGIAGVLTVIAGAAVRASRRRAAPAVAAPVLATTSVPRPPQPTQRPTEQAAVLQAA